MSSRLTSPPRFRFSSRRSSRLLLIWLVGLLFVVGYVVLMSTWQSKSDHWIRFVDVLIPRAMDVLIASWFFFIGSSIGSFLNVVAWRLPRGANVNGRSHCPWCDQTLSWKDNWPVFGWLVLAGRCRTCHLPISPRYPIVELTVGLCIFAVGMFEFYGGGSTLPFHAERWGRTGALWTPVVTRENLVLINYHIVALAVSWALGLVRFDGHRLPRSLVTVSLALIIVPQLSYPALSVVPWQVAMDAQWRADGKYLDAAMRIITGLTAAVVIARSLSRFLSPTADPKLDPLGQGTARLMDLIAMLAVPAVIVGWQAGLAVTVLAALIAYALRLVMRDRDGLSRLSVSLPIVLTVQLCLWRPLHEIAYWPSVGTTPMVTVAWAALVLVIAIGLREPDARSLVRE